MERIEDPYKVSIWITSTGRYDVTMRTVNAFLEHNTYSNIHFLIYHSIPTDASRKTYTAADIGDQRVLSIFERLLDTYPTSHLWADSWPPFGNALNTLLNNSAKYYINLGDANMAVCDGSKQIEAGIDLLDVEENLLSLRLDLADDTVYSGSARFDGTINVPDLSTKYVYWKLYPVSAQLVHTERMKTIGFPQDHDISVKNIVEEYPEAKLRSSPLVCGIDLSYKGFLHHINTVSTTNEDRQWRVDSYQASVKKGYYGPQK